MAVGAQDDEVFDVRAVEVDRTVDEIVHLHDALGHLEADGARLAARRSRAATSSALRRAHVRS